jgi:hypothetical protein
MEFPFRMLTQFRRFYEGTSVLVSLLGLRTEITHEKTDGVARILLGFTGSIPAVVPLATVVVALDASFAGASLQWCGVDTNKGSEESDGRVELHCRMDRVG